MLYTVYLFQASHASHFLVLAFALAFVLQTCESGNANAIANAGKCNVQKYLFHASLVEFETEMVSSSITSDKELVLSLGSILYSTIRVILSIAKLQFFYQIMVISLRFPFSKDFSDPYTFWSSCSVLLYSAPSSYLSKTNNQDGKRHQHFHFVRHVGISKCACVSHCVCVCVGRVKITCISVCVCVAPRL